MDDASLETSRKTMYNTSIQRPEALHSLAKPWLY